MGTHAADGEVESTLVAARLVSVLAAHGRTLATAESLTGGMLGAAITAVPGASAVYVGGAVAYSTSLKTGLLGVPEDLVDQHGVVSPACAEAMAVGVRRLTGADVGLATTGVAGPDAQEGKPVGRVHIAVALEEEARSQDLHLDGSRGAIRQATLRAALSLAASMTTQAWG